MEKVTKEEDTEKVKVNLKGYRTCFRCGKVRRIVGRGVCGSCYVWAHRRTKGDGALEWVDLEEEGCVLPARAGTVDGKKKGISLGTSEKPLTDLEGIVSAFNAVAKECLPGCVATISESVKSADIVSATPNEVRGNDNAMADAILSQQTTPNDPEPEPNLNTETARDESPADVLARAMAMIGAKA